ncbi:MAG: hypothetical protein KDC38_04805 [Planctomycetes bacterium]|nr:hypothetical protein [Planctomycetota bacterium]
MHFSFRAHSQLPRLAWCLILTRGSDEAVVHHGPWVATGDGFLVDGVWDAEFAAGDFDRSSLFCGTGARVRGDRWVVSAPCHPFERLHAISVDDRLIVSPSLSFALEASGRRLSFDFVPYQTQLLHLVTSIAHNVGSAPLADGATVRLFHYRNLEIDRDLSIRVVAKSEPTPPTDYADYERFMIESLRALAENAADPSRGQRFEPLTTVSSGYDSTACAALSTELGGTHALTIRTARSDDTDSGAPVARALGLEVTEFERDTYKGKSGFPEAEFVACGDLGQDLVMLAFEEALPGKMLLTGFHGDTVWGRKPRGGAVHDLRRPDAAGCSLSEYRARVGFLHVPVPCLGGVHLPEICAISNAPEMAPWTLGTRYDRPIPRRLAEERGVGRELFGQDKKAITVLLNADEVLREIMGPDSSRAFQAYYEAHRKERDPAVQEKYDRMFRWSGLCSRLLKKPNAALRRLGPWRIPNPIPFRYSQPTGAPSFLVHWGHSQIRERYRIDATAPAIS